MDSALSGALILFIFYMVYHITKDM